MSLVILDSLNFITSTSQIYNTVVRPDTRQPGHLRRVEEPLVGAGEEVLQHGSGAQRSNKVRKRCAFTKTCKESGITTK